MRVYGGAPALGDAPLYTVALACSEFTVTLVNTTGVAAAVRLNLYPPGGSAATDNEILGDLGVPANGLTILDYPIALNVGDVISGLQDTADACNVWIDVTPSE